MKSCFRAEPSAGAGMAIDALSAPLLPDLRFLMRIVAGMVALLEEGLGGREDDF